MSSFGHKRKVSGGLFVRPRLEDLEDRCLLAVAPLTPGVTFQGTTLRIVTGEGADTVAITDDGAGSVSAEITTSTGEMLSGSGVGVTRIFFHGKGDDVVNYVATGAISISESMFFWLGRDDATANFDFSQGIAGQLNAFVYGGYGDDAVSAQFGDITGKVRFGAELAGGTDTYNLSLLGDVLTGATALFGAGTFGAGNFTVEAPDTDIDPDSLLAIALKGGVGVDTMNLTYQGTIGGTLHVLEEGGWGNDVLAANITVDADSTGHLNAAVLGSFGDDTQTLNIFDNTVPPPAPATTTAAAVASALDDTTSDTGLASLRAVIGDVFGTNTLTHTDNVKVIEPPPRPWWWPRPWRR